MKLAILAVFDSGAMCYSQPMFLPHKGSAVREFMDLCQKKEHAYGQHPEHYKLVELGAYYDDTGRFDLLTVPETLCRGEDVAASALWDSAKK